MATVRPFHGIVYDHTRVPDLAKVTCPPYDVITDDDRDRLYDRHPYNVVRIVSGRGEAGDDDAESRYTRAAGFFRSWQWEGVLRRDPEPAVYVYRQAFTDPSGSFRRVWGLVGTISLDDPVLAHEHTMAGPKADRLALMQAVPSNLSPIYALYRQEGGEVSAGLEELAGSHPVADFVDDEGTRHAVWAVHDPEFHAKVATGLAGSPLMIADGHHRFAVARQYRELRGGPGPWNSIMALLVDAGTQPVCILPYHRIVRRCAADPLSTLREHFEVEPVPDADPARLALGLWDDRRPGGFVAFVGEAAYALRAKSVGPDEIPASTLKRAALDPLGASDAQESLSFTPDAAAVARAVRGGEAVCGFLIQPVDVSRVWDLAAAGATWPEKSTYFHPKPRDGIVIRPLDA